jgi:hypothetical protein
MKKPIPGKPPKVGYGTSKRPVPGAPAPKNLPTPRTAQAPAAKAVAAKAAKAAKAAAVKKEALKRMLPKKGK